MSVMKTVKLDEVTITKGPRRCQQFSFGSSGLSCDWRWPDNHPVWVMSQNDGYGPPWRLYPDKGRLDEDGRKAILPDLYFLVRQAQFVHDVGDLGKQRRA